MNMLDTLIPNKKLQLENCSGIVIRYEVKYFDSRAQNCEHLSTALLDVILGRQCIPYGALADYTIEVIVVTIS